MLFSLATLASSLAGYHGHFPPGWNVRWLLEAPQHCAERIDEMSHLLNWHALFSYVECYFQ